MARENIDVSVFRAVLWDKISDSLKRILERRTHGIWTAAFYTLQEFTAFSEACFGHRYLKLVEENDCESSVIFVCPYGLLLSSFGVGKFPELEPIFVEKGWPIENINTEVSLGKLQCSYQ